MLLKKVENLKKELSKTLPQEEVNNGWSETSRMAMLHFFEVLESDLKNNIDVSQKIEYCSIARGLDHWGVSTGEFLEKAIDISADIRKL